MGFLLEDDEYVVVEDILNSLTALDYEDLITHRPII